MLDATAEARAAKADLVVTFGGGSVTDGGKMVRLCLQNNVTDLDGFDAFRSVTLADGTRTVPKFEGPKIAQIAVPTTLAGGEFNNQAGCTDLRVQIKHGYRHADLMPRTVVLDPAPSVHAPLQVWLSTGMRAVDHALGHVLGGSYEVPQGDASSIVLPHVLRFNRAVNAAQQRTVVEAMGFPNDDAADVVAALASDIGTPRRLSDVGIERAHFAAIADHAMHESWLHSNPRPITDAAQIMDILNAAA